MADFQDYEEAEVLEHAMLTKSFFAVLPPPPCPLKVVEEVEINRLTLSIKQQITDLFVANMRDRYLAAGWECNVAEKQKELFHKASRFILLLRPVQQTGDVTSITTEEVVGYIMFRFTWDDEDEPEYPVLYVYELQVQQQALRQGLGRYLLQYVLQLSKHLGMRKVLLTCLKNSTDALAFYRSMGLGIDMNSPSRGGFHKEVYEILSDKPDYQHY